MAITVKFVGSLRHASGAECLGLDCAENACVRTLISEITEKRPELKHSLIDQQLQDPRINALILVNGREINVLNGLETRLNDGDELVLIPVVHGG
jgi:molybdopterin synthase sulfur carrier subunit